MTEIIDIVEPAIPGSKGDTGPAGEIVDATATALPTGADPTVTLGGTPSERTIEFGLPRGPKGDPGDGSVNSVNGDLGPDVVLSAQDIGALPDTTTPADIGALPETATPADIGAVALPSPQGGNNSILVFNDALGEYVPAAIGAGLEVDAGEVRVQDPALPDIDWVNLSYAPGFTSGTAGQARVCRYNGVVYFQGGAQASTGTIPAGQSVIVPWANIPEWARPPRTIMFAARASSNRVAAMSASVGGANPGITVLPDTTGTEPAWISSHASWPAVNTHTGPGSLGIFTAQTRPVYVSEHGAVGNGSVDDLAAIQSALDAGSGRTVMFDHGRVYRINGSLTFRANTVVDLNGSEIRRGDRTMAYILDVSNVTVKNGTFEAHRAGNDQAINHFVVQRSSGIRFEDMTFRNITDWHSIDTMDVDGLEVIRCVFEGFRRTSPEIRAFSEAIQFDVSGGTAPALTWVRNVLVEGCTVRDSGTSGYGPWRGGFGNHTARSNVEHQGFRFINNNFEGCLFAGLGIFGFKDVEIRGNRFIDCNVGVLVRPANNSGLTLPMRPNVGVVISGNVIRGTASGATENDGILADWIEGGAITDNVVANVRTGISLGHSKGVSIASNHVSQTRGRAVEMIDTRYPSHPLQSQSIAISGNTITDAGTESVGVASDVQSVTLVGNNSVGGRRTSAGTCFFFAGGTSDLAMSGNVNIKGSSPNDTTVGCDVENVTRVSHAGNLFSGTTVNIKE